MKLDLELFNKIDMISDKVKRDIVGNFSLNEVKVFRDMLFEKYKLDIKKWQSMNYLKEEYTYLQDIVDKISGIQQTCREYDKIEQETIDAKNYSEVLLKNNNEMDKLLKELKKCND